MPEIKYSKNNTAYHSKWSNKGCQDDYIGKTNLHIIERIKDCNVRDKNSHLLNCAPEKGRIFNWENYIKILDKN